MLRVLRRLPSPSSRFLKPSNRFFSNAEPVLETAQLYPLGDNEHILPKSVPALPKKFEESHWVWVSGIDSALLRPPGWFANESTVQYPWEDLTGNPMRVCYITEDDLKVKGFIESGFTVSAYRVDRQQGQMTEYVKNNKMHVAVETFFAPIRLADPNQDTEDTNQDGQMTPKLNPAIQILKRKATPPFARDRFPVHSTRMSYVHKNFTPEGVMGVKAKDIRFELEWLASDATGWCYEVSFQAPTDVFAEKWDEHGKMMMNTQKGLHLNWRR